MRYNIKILLTVCILCFCCKKEEVPAFFDGEDLVYFGSPLFWYDSTYPDSLGINFDSYTYPEDKDSIFKLSVFAQGRKSDKDREFKISTAGSTAKQGEDFIIPEKFEIPANKIKVDIPIRIIRTPKLRKDTVVIRFKLEPNEYFKTNLTGVNGTENYDEFKVGFTDSRKEPDDWKKFKNYMGPFSVKKIQLFAKITQGLSPNKSYSSSISNWKYLYENKMNDLIKLIKAYLKAQADAGTPVLEDDGKPMVLGPDA